MPWKPSEPGEIPTLGYYVVDWIQECLAAPDRQDYEPFRLTREQVEFILRFYEINPLTGKRTIRRGVLSRSRGWGKSPFLAALAIAEGVADVVPDGWDAEGQPVGKPWREVRTPLVQVAAATEDQTQNSWDPLLEMLNEDAPIFDYYSGIEPMAGFVNLPRGQIKPITASATSTKGNRAVFAIMDQTEMWTASNGGVKLANVMLNNAAKSSGGSVIETPNAYIPGTGSVAERTAAAWKAMIEGRAKMDAGIYYDHREAPPETELYDRESLVAGLRYAYGCSSDHPDGCVLHGCPPGWASIDSFVARTWDADMEAQDARADFLNQITFASNSWLSEPEWAGCKDEGVVVTPRDAITLGFDGSRGRAKGKPDASALIGCRVKDGHLFKIAIWEAGDEPHEWPEWEAPVEEINATVADTFKRFNVVGFYADPGKDWRSHVNQWEAKYSSKVKVKGTAAHPFEWWMTGGRAGLVQRSIEQMESAVRNQDLTHDGSLALTRHVLNARRRFTRDKLSLSKENDYSARKIDAAVAAVLAFQCRLDALSAGAGPKKRSRATIQRVR